MTHDPDTGPHPPEEAPDTEQIREVAGQARTIGDSKTVARISALSSGAKTLRKAIITITFGFIVGVIAKMVFALLSTGSLTDPFYSPLLAITAVVIGFGMVSIAALYLFVGVLALNLRRTHGSMFNDYDEDFDAPLSGRELLFHLVQSVIMGLAGSSVLGIGVLYMMAVTPI